MTGGSTLICLDLKGGKKAAFAFQNALDIVLISNNLGDAKSLITHPATTTHKNLTDEARAELGIGPGTLRLSVGTGGRGRSDRGYRAGAEISQVKGPDCDLDKRLSVAQAPSSSSVIALVRMVIALPRQSTAPPSQPRAQIAGSIRSRTIIAGMVRGDRYQPLAQASAHSGT